MSKEDNMKDILPELLALSARYSGGELPKHAADCNETLVVDFVSGNLDAAGIKFAKEKIFSCRACASLAIKLAARNAQSGPAPKLQIGENHAGFLKWKNSFETKHSYSFGIKFKGRELSLQIRGFLSEISGKTTGFYVKIGDKVYRPDENGIIKYPEAASAKLCSEDGSIVNIHETAGLR